MQRGKWLAAAYCAAVLGVQAWVIAETTSYNNRLWPFVNYPMYSRAFYPGAQVEHVQLVGRRCGPRPDSVLLAAREIGMMTVPLSNLVTRSTGLRGASPEQMARASARLRRQVHARMPELCSLEAWTRSYRMGPRGLELPGIPPRLLNAWPLSPDTMAGAGGRREIATP